MSVIRTYLEQVTRLCPGAALEAFLMEHGGLHNPAPRPRDIARATPKTCFVNAVALVRRRTDLKYAEGLAYRQGLIPVHHAWCVGLGVTVVDTTWGDPEDCEYLGVVFPTGRLDYWLLQQGHYCLLDGPSGPNRRLFEEWAQ